ncbi:CAAX amino terminal protease self- immunity [Phycisphaerae bacterium RAS1]|nr:CAAX amino terminal protease self- immunity [Phycisphaerae bacterium RAS1]
MPEGGEYRSDDPVLARPVALSPAAVPPAPLPARPVDPLDLSHINSLPAAGGVILTLLTVALTLFGVPIVAVALADTLGWFSTTDPHSGDGLLLASKWVEAGLAMLVAAVCLWRLRVRPAGLGLHFQRPSRQAAWALAALACVYAAMIGFAIFVIPLINAFPQMQRDLAHRVEFVQMVPVSNVGMAALLMAAVAIHEEVLFRGLLIPLLARVLRSKTAAVMASSALFGALHITQGFMATVQIGFVGAALGICFVASRSLPAVIVAHFLFNLLQLQLMRLLPSAEELLRELQK